MRSISHFIGIGWCSVFSLLVLSASFGNAKEPAVEDLLRSYVQQPDAAYSWEVARTIEGSGTKTHVVQLTSQRWRGDGDVDRSLWQHWMLVVVPEKVKSKMAFLFVGGGSNGKQAPEKIDGTVAQIAASTGSVVIELKQTPNQPLIFGQDGVKRNEDDLIAYAWNKYLETKDHTWLPRLPMVKGVVRAMDCVQELLKQEQYGGHAIEKFTVAGGSKRGWTTWMTATADPRVAAIVPIVIDVANVDASMRHHAAVYGFWSHAIGDYVKHGITKQWDSEPLRQLLKIEDPYFQRDRLTMPKFIVNAAGDQFFCPDSSQFYYDDLPGEKLLRYVPNADHSLRNSDAIESIAAYYQMLLNGRPRPRYSWKFETDGSIRVTTADKPRRVLLWQATNAKARDFRLTSIGPAYRSQELKPQGDGSFVGQVPQPPEGWTAFFVELTYDTDSALQLKLTTGVRVLPDKLPYANLDLKSVPFELER
ncbi:MAG: PhoPQ-activated pathogenicity-related family protein [Planctomycetota bacterium]